MTDNEIKREKTFEEELPYFKERIQEVFDNYSNPNGNEDTLEICVLRESNRIVKKAEKTINCQKAEIESLKEENNVLRRYIGIQSEEQLSQIIADTSLVTENIKAEAVKEYKEKLICEIVNRPAKNNPDGVFYNNGRVDRQNEIIDIIKELAGENK